MISAEVRTLIRQEIRQTLTQLLHGKTTAENTTEDQQLQELWAGGAVAKDKYPVLHPYGFCSRMPTGKLVCHAQVGEHIGARMVLGCRDEKRTDLDIESGEVCLYDELGNKITLRNAAKKIELQVKDGDQIEITEDKINLGGSAADQPVVLGTVIVELLGKILDKLIAGNIVLTTSPGNPTAPEPSAAVAFNQMKTQYLSTSSSNIISDHVFVSRSK